MTEWSNKNATRLVDYSFFDAKTQVANFVIGYSTQQPN